MTPGQSWALLALVALFAILLTRAIVLIERKAERAVTLGFLALGRNDMADAYDLAVENALIDEANEKDWMTRNIGKPFELDTGAWMVPVNSTSAAYGTTREAVLAEAAKYLPALTTKEASA